MEKKTPRAELVRRMRAKTVKDTLRQIRHLLAELPKTRDGERDFLGLNPGDQQRVRQVRGALTEALESFWSEGRQ